jgi:sugar (pentulose or hexulose) kinase
MRRHLEFLAGSGCPAEKLLVGGGAASSRVTPQLLADVTGLPLGCLKSGTSSLLGAAVLARGLVELETPLAALAEAMAPPAVRFEPGPEAPRYQERYQRYLHSLPVT